MKPAYLLLLLFTTSVFAAPYDRQLRDFPNHGEDGKHCVNYADGTYICQDMDDVKTLEPYEPTEQEAKIESALECIRLAGISKEVQKGRRTHKDEWRDFMNKVPPYLSENGLSEKEITVVIGIAMEVFQMDILLSPKVVFERYYNKCVGIDDVIIIDDVVIKIDPTNTPI